MSRVKKPTGSPSLFAEVSTIPQSVAEALSLAGSVAPEAQSGHIANATTKQAPGNRRSTLWSPRFPALIISEPAAAGCLVPSPVGEAGPERLDAEATGGAQNNGRPNGPPEQVGGVQRKLMTNKR